MLLKQAIKKALPTQTVTRINKRILSLYEKMALKSIKQALSEQDMTMLFNQLSEIVPNIKQQYCSIDLNGEYYTVKVRALHAFQISLVKDALSLIKNKLEKKDTVTLVDIGDSAGTHTLYIQSLFQRQNIHCLSINLDKAAVEKIKEKGLDAVCMRAEELPLHSIKPDICLSFQMLEHLMDPFLFLRNLSHNSQCSVLVVTVPYREQSRVGLHHIRLNQERTVNTENTHILELSPVDWQLIFKHAGWKVVTERIFFQYPRRSLLASALRLKNFWQHYDYEGFYGVILSRDNYWSKLYESWE